MNIEISIRKRINFNEVNELADFIEQAQVDSDSLIREYNKILYSIAEFVPYDLLFIKAKIKDELVGLMFGCNLNLLTKENKNFLYFYISDMAVKLSYRNIGVAKAILNKLEMIAKSDGYRGIVADVKINGRSHRLFKAIGYINTHKQSTIGFQRLIKIL